MSLSRFTLEIYRDDQYRSCINTQAFSVLVFSTKKDLKNLISQRAWEFVAEVVYIELKYSSETRYLP